MKSLISRYIFYPVSMESWVPYHTNEQWVNHCMATGQGCGSYSGQQWGKSLVTGHVISGGGGGGGGGGGVHNGLYHWPLVMCDTWVSKQQCIISLATGQGWWETMG